MMITAQSAMDLSAGVVRYAKGADVPQIPASVLKTLTFYTARQTITDAMLNDTVTVAEEDLLGGSTAHLQEGDVISWDALFHGMMMPSGNDAAHCVARCVGELLPGTGDPYERFVARMNEVCVEDFEWTSARCASSSGLDTDSRLTARQVCELLLTVDEYIVGVAGTQTYQATVTGPNARTLTFTHTIDPNGEVHFPEMIAAKGGTLFNPPRANVAMLWQAPGGQRHALAVLHDWPSLQRYESARAVIDYVEDTPAPGDRGGLALPFSIDAVATSGSLEIDNAGNSPAPAVLRIDGPAPYPSVRHVEQRASLTFDLIVESGQWLEVDLDNHTVLLNGQASRRGQMRGQWFDLAPGQNTLTFNALTYHPDARLTVEWRDAYR